MAAKVPRFSFMVIEASVSERGEGPEKRWKQAPEFAIPGLTRAQWLLVRSGAVSELSLAVGDRRVGGALLIAAGLYQATPLKRACLDACRSPLSFLMRLWRPGWAGAARLGFAHGVYCLGCSTPSPKGAE